MIKYLYIFFNLLALTAISAAGVDTFYRLVRLQIGKNAGLESVRTPPPARPPQRDLPTSRYQAVIDRHIFGATAIAPPPTEEAVSEMSENLAPTSLKITLLGTITGDQEVARAIISDDNNKTQGLYRIADAIQGAVIKKILRGKVIIQVGGEDQVLTMAEDGGAAGDGDQTAAAVAGSDSPIALKQEELQQSFNNINQLLSQVRIRPYFKDGKADGFVVNRIQPDSLFNKLGLENGDVIHTVNGQDIKSPEDAIAFYNSLKSDSQIALLITRQGQRKTLNYNIR